MLFNPGISGALNDFLSFSGKDPFDQFADIFIIIAFVGNGVQRCCDRICTAFDVLNGRGNAVNDEKLGIRISAMLRYERGWKASLYLS